MAGNTQDRAESACKPVSRPSGHIPGVDLPPASLDLEKPVYGFDPSTKRMSLAVVGRGLEHVDSLTVPKALDNQRRYTAAYDALVPWLTGQLGRGVPSHVFVEQPFAKSTHVHPSSYYMIGALLTALGGVLPADVEVRFCSPSEWKCRALGKGHGRADKDEVMDWARSVAGYTGSLEDEADSVGIATAGALLISGVPKRRAA